MASIRKASTLSPAQHARQQRDTVTDREQRDIGGHLLEPIQKEDHAEQEQQMVITGDHVLGAKVHERQQVQAAGILQERLILGRDAMSQCLAAEQTADEGEDQMFTAPASGAVKMYFS